jgi:purine-binding chemotaxis protein CheW
MSVSVEQNAQRQSVVQAYLDDLMFSEELLADEWPAEHFGEPLVEGDPGRVAPLVKVHWPAASGGGPTRLPGVQRPWWAAGPFECLLLDVGGLTLAVPLACMGSIYPLHGQALTPLLGEPDGFLGVLPSRDGELKVLDTARWIMPERYRDDLRENLQYLVSVQGNAWGLAVHQVSRSMRLHPHEITWRSQSGQRRWLAGTAIEHRCALLDIGELAQLIAAGAGQSVLDATTHTFT